MHEYQAFYRGKKITVLADTSYEAQTKAAKEFKAKKAYDVAVVIVTVNVNSNPEPVEHKADF